MIRSRLLAISVLLLSCQAAAQDGSTLTTTGNGQVRVEPDLALVRLGVTSRDASARVAQDRVNTTLESIVAAVTGLGIGREQIQTSQLSLQPVYSRDRGETPRILAYTASYTVTVRVLELSRVGPSIDAALEAGANRLDGVSFGVADEGPHKRRALQAAVRDARSKAEALAEAADLKILSILEIAEGSVAVRSARAPMMSALEASAPTPVLPGELTISGQVTVTYRLGPR